MIWNKIYAPSSAKQLAPGVGIKLKAYVSITWRIVVSKKGTFIPSALINSVAVRKLNIKDYHLIAYALKNILFLFTNSSLKISQD